MLKGLIVILTVFFTSMAHAGQSHIEMVELQKSSSGWSAHVTLRHADSGWEHYADGWRVVDSSGKVLGHRTLFHPHENEQPFTRSLSNIQIPASTKIVYVEAHDKVHGWNPDRVKIDMGSEKGERYWVRQ